jgi:hypothetical protein
MADGHRVDTYKLASYLEATTSSVVPGWTLDPRVEPERWDEHEKPFESIVIGSKLLQAILLCAGRGSVTEAVWQLASDTLQRAVAGVREGKLSLPVRDLDLRAALIALQQLTITSATTDGITPARVHEVVTALHSLFTSPVHVVGLPLSIRFAPQLMAGFVRKVPAALTAPSVSVLHDLLLRSFNGPAIDEQFALHMVKLATTLMDVGTKLMSPDQVCSLLAAMLHLADALFSSSSRLELVAHMFQSFGELSVQREPDSLIAHIRPHGLAITRLLLRIFKSNTSPASWPLHSYVAKFLIPVLDRLLTHEEMLHWGPLLHAQLKAGLALEERDEMGQLSVRTTDLRCAIFEAWTALVRVMRGDFIGGLWDCVEAIERRMAPDYWKHTATPLSLQQDLMLKAMGPIGIEQKDEQHDQQGDDAPDPSDDKEQKEQEGSDDQKEEDEETEGNKAAAQEQEAAEEKKAAANEEQADASMPAAAEADAGQAAVEDEDEFINDNIPYWRRYEMAVRASSDDEEMTQDQRRESAKMPLGLCNLYGQNHDPTHLLLYAALLEHFPTHMRTIHERRMMPLFRSLMAVHGWQPPIQDWQTESAESMLTDAVVAIVLALPHLYDDPERVRARARLAEQADDRTGQPLEAAASAPFMPLSCLPPASAYLVAFARSRTLPVHRPFDVEVEASIAPSMEHTRKLLFVYGYGLFELRRRRAGRAFIQARRSTAVKDADDESADQPSGRLRTKAAPAGAAATFPNKPAGSKRGTVTAETAAAIATAESLSVQKDAMRTRELLMATLRTSVKPLQPEQDSESWQRPKRVQFFAADDPLSELELHLRRQERQAECARMLRKSGQERSNAEADGAAQSSSKRRRIAVGPAAVAAAPSATAVLPFHSPSSAPLTRLSLRFLRSALLRAWIDDRYRGQSAAAHECNCECRVDCRMTTKLALVHSCLRMIGALALCGEPAAAAVCAALLGREEDGTRAVNSFGNLWQIIQLYAAHPAFRGSAALLCGELVQGLSTARPSVSQKDASAAVFSLREDDKHIESILREAQQISASARPSNPVPAQRT